MRDIYKSIRYAEEIFLILILLCGCSILDTSDKKISDIEFTVVDETTLPEEVLKMIEERKAEAFQMAYHDGSYSYIIVGYGMQESSGYSIQVNDVYQGEDGIWVDTDLIGPEKSEQVESVTSYPYVIIKIEGVDQTIRFKR